MIKLETVEQLQVFLVKNPNALILKHSTSCSISTRAYQEFSSFAANSSIPAAVILVIEEREVSQHLAQLSGMRHASPQLLFFCNGQCCQSLSHYQITAANIRAVLEGKG